MVQRLTVAQRLIRMKTADKVQFTFEEALGA